MREEYNQPASPMNGGSGPVKCYQCAPAPVEALVTTLLTLALAVSVVLGTSSTLGFGLVISDWRALLLFGLGAMAGTLAVGTCRAGQPRATDG